MAKPKYREPEKPEPAILVISRKSASEKINAQIEKGKQLLIINISSIGELDDARAEYSKWDSYNIELLKRIFSNSSVSDEYVNYGASWAVMNPSFQQRVESFNKSTQSKITRLEAIFDRLELFPESAQHDTSVYIIDEKPLGRDIFLVHGLDNAAKESVARYLEKLDLNVIILHERPNAGKTLIEKLIHNSKVGFAVVLMTPDDIGSSIAEPDKKSPRARQNVIFELGYFLGCLGRERVCALHKPDVVPPSDWDGVVYVPMDTAGGWRILLAKEIKQAGIDIDLNKAL